MTYAAVGLVVGAVVQILLLAWLARRIGAIGQLEQRVTRLASALALLTDTAEAGFRAMAERAPAQASRPRTLRPATARDATRRTKAATKRVARAAQRGKSVQEIAAAEKVSEGEVRLRMHVAKATPASA